MNHKFYTFLLAIAIGLLSTNLVFAAPSNMPNTEFQTILNQEVGLITPTMGQSSSPLNRTTFASSKGIKNTPFRRSKDYTKTSSQHINTASYLQTRHPNSMQALNLYSKENTSMSTGPSTKATAFQSQSFSAFSSSEPFSSSSSISYSGPQYSFPSLDGTSPEIPAGPLGNEIIPLALLISSFVLYKFIKH